MGLAHKYVNLKEAYNQDIKEPVATKYFLKKKTLYMKCQPQRHSVQKVFFKFTPLFVVLTFEIICQPRSGSMRKKLLDSAFETS